MVVNCTEPSQDQKTWESASDLLRALALLYSCRQKAIVETAGPCLSLAPRPLPKEGRPGIHCLRMRETTPGFYGGSYNSVPYRRLYLWTVRERPFYCLGVAFTGKAAGCESVYTLFHRRRLRSDNSLMRVALFCV